MGILRAIVLAGAVLCGNATAAHAGCSVGQMLELPVTMSGLRPMVSATVNGHEARFIADSGAFYSLISPGAAAEFGLSTSAVPGLALQGSAAPSRRGSLS